MKQLSIFFFFLTVSTVFAQKTGLIQGTVKDKATQEALIGVSIIVAGSNPIVGTTTDIDGKYQLSVPVGSVNLKASYIGYKPENKFNVVVSTGNANIINFEILEEATSVGEVVVSANRTIRATTVEAPNSIQRLSAEEIKSNPGGNFDIFKVVQSLPGIGAPPGVGNRNDIVVRGGAPGENVYYLDGIEIPVINHFATQGSSGGSNGILNVSFIEELTLNSSAFDARYDNALSSVFQFRQRDGNAEHFQGNVRLSSSELSTTLEGPINKKTTFLASARRSYLQYLLKGLGLSIRPDYWDFQYKVTHKINNKTSLTFLGLGAIDDFYTDITQNTSATNAYIIKNTPVIKQWNYTTGVAVKHLFENGYLNFALSRNMAENRFSRFEDGLRDDITKRLFYSVSQEIENKARLDVNQFFEGFKLSYGASAQYVKYNNDFNAIFRREIKNAAGQIVQPGINFMFNTDIKFFKYGAFAQLSKQFMGDKLGLSIGLRSDANSFIIQENQLLKTLSPRVSLSYEINKKWKANASFGQYSKLPAYTVLGYKGNDGILANKAAKYVNSTHYVAGLEFIPRESTRITVEGFYKTYANYPVSVRDGISLANQGSDFGTIGNELVTSDGKGNAVGFELFFQQKLTKNFFMFTSYTYVVSKFSGKDGKLIPSAWDNRHLLSTTIGRKFGKGWEIGVKYRLAGGVPYTPFDLEASRKNYVSQGQGVLDYNKINTERLKSFQQMDFRIDKKINFKRTALDLYFDLSNALFIKNQRLPSYVFERLDDNSGFKTTDGNALRYDGSNGIPSIRLGDEQASFVPSLGFIFEF
ncbi:MAG: hypothetical protein RLZZ292_239 [Bacteroidota bacterium]|jgi:hypothetical protein